MQNSRLELFRVRYFFFHHCDTSNQERIGLKEFSDLKAAGALNEDLTLTVRERIHPENVRRGAYSVQVFGLWDVYIWIALGNKSNRQLLAHSLFDGVEPFRAADHNRHDHGRKEYPAAQGYDDHRSRRDIEARLGFRGFVLFSLHECFLISMMNSPSWKEISPTDRGFSPPMSRRRGAGPSRRAGLSQIFAPPPGRLLGSGPSPRMRSSPPSSRPPPRSAATP